MDDNLEAAARGIAPAILAILKQDRQVSAALEGYYKTCLKWIVREFPALPTKMSTGARDKARELGFPTLIGMKWSQQTKYDPRRTHLMWEHMLPVGDIVGLLWNLPHPDEEQIVDVFRGYRVAWILKIENAKLPKTGRIDPEGAYRAAGIELVDLF